MISAFAVRENEDLILRRADLPPSREDTVRRPWAGQQQVLVRTQSQGCGPVPSVHSKWLLDADQPETEIVSLWGRGLGFWLIETLPALVFECRL